MRLLDIIQGKLIIPTMRSRNKWDAIEELVDKLVEEHEIRIFDEHEVLEAVLAREKSQSTGLNDHVALPHGRTSAVEDVVGVLGIAPTGIPFESTDGEDSQLICLLVIPDSQYRDYVRTVTDVPRRLSNPQFRLELVEAGRTGSLEQVCRAIEHVEGPAFLAEEDMW
jgi:PTS system nitrogen regulatory IIA component